MNDVKDATMEATTAQDVLNQLEQRGLAVPEPRTVGRSATVQAPAVPQHPVVMEMTEEIADLFGALAKAQGEFGDIERTMTARIKSKRDGGADYSYDYAPLDVVLGAVRPALSKNGIALMQFPQVKSSSVVVRTMLAHESGQRIWNDLAVGCNSTDPKDIASAITYAKRYALQALLGIAPDTDDDGNRGRGETAQVQPRANRPSGKPEAQAPTDAPVKSLVTSCRPLQRNGKTIYAIKSTTGECFTEDKALYDVAQAAMRAERGVVLVTEERRADTTGRTYRALVEIAKD